MTGRARLFVSPRAADRLACARAWLDAQPANGSVLIVGETLHGPLDLLAGAVGERGAVLGLRRTTLDLLATDLAASGLQGAGLVAAGSVARDALVARALAEGGAAGRFTRVEDTPGFIRSVGRSIEELWLAGLTASALETLDPDLAALGARIETAWASAGLASSARQLEAAADAARDADARHDALDVPLLLLDVRVSSWREAELVRALATRAPSALVTIATRDARTRRLLEGPPFDPAELQEAPEGGRALDRLVRHLFVSAPTSGAEDPSVTVFSAPGEARECVEIARRLLERADRGTPFDRCAVLLRQPEDYRPYLAEALARAGVPAFFARGVRRPDPAGRAFVSLLRCRAEGYSALRFAEYLSIGQVPELGPDGAPGAPPPAETRWRAPDPEAAAAGGRLELEGTAAGGQLDLELLEAVEPAAGAPGEPPEAEEPSAEARLPVPRRWEKLLVESAVVGRLDRWQTRLDGLREQLELQKAGLEVEDADQPGVERIERQIEDLAHLRAYALPLLDELAALPDETSWGAWLDALDALAARWLRDPQRVQATLGALAPMRPLGPVTLAEVLRALAPRLLEATEPPGTNRFGRVFVGAIDEARGMSFDVVFVPGLAERVFPPKIAEDPILLDEVRRRLDAPARLVTNEDRVADERLALGLAVGAATDALVLSYARIEAGKARPRVPSFYALEAVRAAEGELPEFEELAKRAEDVADARIGWPAPKRPERAIDEAEYDLAVLDDLGLRGDEAVRAAGHLLNTNPHLARALRFRAYRWEVRRWTWADGLLDPGAGARQALAAQAPDARAFSATALQHFAACPYRFYLQALMRLAPRETPAGIDELDPLERGSLVHQTQFELFERLEAESTAGAPLLPIDPANRGRVLEILDEVLRSVAADFHERLVPAIDRVWEDGIEAIRQDLRQWIHRESLDESPFRPWRFEFSFGLPPDPNRDEHSVLEPVDLGVGLSLRGAIDLVERTPEGILRVTDHKTGRLRARRGAVIQGGELLQPVLYALAASRLFPDDTVRSGRLYYCTADGNFATHEVRLDEGTTRSARVLGEVVGQAFAGERFPALPKDGACRWCDYLSICGPDEERRVRRKPTPTELERLRREP